jgi:hypothetical protein
MQGTYLHGSTLLFVWYEKKQRRGFFEFFGLIWVDEPYYVAKIVQTSITIHEREALHKYSLFDDVQSEGSLNQGPRAK